MPEIITNPVKAIRAKCLDCCCGQVNEVKLCPCPDCPLYPFRLGKNPYRQKRELTEEQKAVARERLQKARLSKNHWLVDRENRREVSADKNYT